MLSKILNSFWTILQPALFLDRRRVGDGLPGAPPPHPAPRPRPVLDHAARPAPALQIHPGTTTLFLYFSLISQILLHVCRARISTARTTWRARWTGTSRFPWRWPGGPAGATNITATTISTPGTTTRGPQTSSRHSTPRSSNASSPSTEQSGRGRTLCTALEAWSSLYWRD